MKKHYFFSAILALCVSIIAIVSCTQEGPQEVTPVATEQVYENLNKQLIEYSESFCANHPQIQTRGFRDFFNKLCRFMKTDFCGIFGGRWQNPDGKSFWGSSISLSIGASIKSVTDNYQIPLDINFTLEENEELMKEVFATTMPGEFNDGYYHNKIILSLYEKDRDIFTSNAETVMNAIVAELDSMGINVSKTVAEINTELQYCMTNIVNESDEMTFANLKAHYPQKAQKIEVMETYFKTAAKIATRDELIAYSKQVQAIIQEAELQSADKWEIMDHLSVILASKMLWGEGQLPTKE